MRSVLVRSIQERDIEAAADVNFLAFYHVATAHRMAPVVTTPAESRSYVRYLHGFDPAGGIVAEENGDIIGLAWVHPRGPVATIGPIAVAPPAQGRGVGRQLLERAIELAGGGVPQVRLVQESFNESSLGLYLRTGFRVVAPLVELALRAGSTVVLPPPPAVTIRPAVPADRVRLVDRDARAFGAPRPQSIDLYLRRGRAMVAERGASLTGYALAISVPGVAYLGSAAAEDPETVMQLAAPMAAALAADGAAVRTLVPATDRRLVDGFLALGFRVFRACQYMVRGGGTAPPPNYVLMNGDMM